MYSETDDYFKPLTLESMINELRLIDGKEAEFYFRGQLTSLSVTLNSPAAPEELKHLEEECRFRLPEDYMKFLRLANGVQFGDYESRICSIEDTLGFCEPFSDVYPENWLVIATGEGASVHIIMEVLSDTTYNLYTTEAIGDDEIHYFGDDLLSFIDMYISTYGYPFWKWINSTRTLTKMNVD